jgi:hypothetical protein
MKVIKTTFEKEQTEKDEAFLKLSALQRMDRMRKVRDLMRKKGIQYSYQGQKVTVTKPS